MKGLAITDTPMGFKSVRLHYSADPDHDPETETGLAWYKKQRALYADPNQWQIEYEINFDVGAGRRVFPEFSYEKHCAKLEFNPRKVINRGWDFGWHAPVSLAGQIDKKDRLLILKEVVGSQTTTRDHAQSVISKCSEWYPNHQPGYADYCDPAGQQVKSVESEKNERRDTEVLNGLGIYPEYAWGWSRKDGRSLIHQLLNTRSDGTPSLIIDPEGCPVLYRAFAGQYVFPETLNGKIKEEPNDEDHPTGDVMAALRYLVIGLHGKLGVARFQMGQAQHFVQVPSSDTHGYGIPRRGRR
jgi:hypothetical protein